MLDMILYAFGIFMMVFGIVSLIFIIVLKANTPYHRDKYYTVIKLTYDNDPSAQISCALERRNILGECGVCEIIAVDCGLAESELDFLKNMYGKNNMLYFIDKSEICKYITF